MRQVVHSVTKFGEISPLWHNLQSLGQFLDGLFTIWQNFEPTLASFIYFWANFHRCKWPNVENDIAIWSHKRFHSFYSAVDSTAPTILPPWVRVPSTPSMLSSFIVQYVLYLSWEKNKNKQKEAGSAH